MTIWLDEQVRGSVRPNTYESYAYTLKHILPTIGHIQLTKLSHHHLAHLYRQKRSEGLTRTVVLIHALISMALEHALGLGIVPRNVAKLIRAPKSEAKPFRALTPEEVGRFMKAASADRLYAMYVLAITGGLRQGELFGLLWTDISFEKGTLTVQRQLQWLKTPTFVSPKTAHARRTIALSEMAVKALRAHHALQDQERHALGDAWQDEHGLVFTTTVGTPLHPSSVRRRSFARVLSAAGLPPMRFHDLRHTCATLLLGQGVHPKLVQQQLGHGLISVTLDTYSHVTPPMLRETATKMDEALAPKDAR